MADLLLAPGVAVAGWTAGGGLQRFKLEDRSVTIKGLASEPGGQP